MKCPECIKEGKTSTVYVGAMRKTLMYCQPFYDKEGKYHNHDSNTTFSDYTCSNGHSGTEFSTGSCWCGWGKKEEMK